MPVPFPHRYQTWLVRTPSSRARLDIARARATLDEAKQHCLIVNAVRAPVEIEAKIRPPAVRKAG